MTQARREGEKGRQRERRRDRGEQNDSTLSCCTEYDDGTVLSFRLVGECLSFRTPCACAGARVCLRVRGLRLLTGAWGSHCPRTGMGSMTTLSLSMKY